VHGPLKRIGRRGEGNFQEITWEEAIAEVAEKLSAIRNAGRPHSVACMTGPARGTVPALFTRFMEAFGSPNVFSNQDSWDTHRQVAKVMYGVDAYPGFDLENASLILSFGSGLLDGWGSPVHMLAGYGESRKSSARPQTRIVQVEPRLSLTAAKSDEWVAAKPGTEAALALAMAHVIIKENLYNKNFVAFYTRGLTDWTDENNRPQVGFARTVLENYSPVKMAAITGVDPQTVERLARQFAKAERPVAVCGRAQGDQAGEFHTFLAVHALNALAGNINRPGGVRIKAADDEAPAWPLAKGDSTSRAGLKRPRLDAVPVRRYPLAENLPHTFADAVLKGEPYKLEVLLVAGGDPGYFLPASSKVKEALTRIPLVVSFSPVYDDTAMFADYILPDHLYLESLRDVPSPPGLATCVIGLARPVVDPVYKTRHAGDSVLEIAKAMSGSVAASFPWGDYEECLREAMGDKWGDMEDQGYWKEQAAAPSWTETFGTPSRRFEFCPDLPQGGGRISVKPKAWVAQPLGDPKTHPLVAVPIQSMRLENGTMGAPPFVVKCMPDTVLEKDWLVVEVNPRTAKAYGIGDGNKALLSTSLGQALVMVLHDEGIMPGLVGVPAGLGHVGYDRFLRGKGANYHALSGAVEDPVTGNDVAWGVYASLRQA
ncbi:MAG: molybdopterin-dependent oxidoreductase, partial [Pseudomonadota bacterium]